MRIRPFCALRPTTDKAPRVACPPYDVVSTAEAIQYAAGNEDCFFHVTRPEIDLPPDIDPYSDEVYRKASENFLRFIQRGVFIQEEEPALYMYRLKDGAHVQHGIMALCSVEDYRANRIRRHEKTRKIPEEDRTRHIAAVRANTGPVLLTYRANAAVVGAIDAAVTDITQGPPLYDFTARDGVQHSLWGIWRIEPLITAFEHVPVFYIADGHHRAAAAARYAEKRSGEHPGDAPSAEYNWFMALICPAHEMRILPYHRLVKDLNGMTVEEFLSHVGEEFRISETDSPVPRSQGEVCMFVAERWYRLNWDPPRTPDPVRALDVSVLQERLLGPVLGIDDPRNSPRMEFVGGDQKEKYLEEQVRSGKGAVAFSMFPTSIDSLMHIADLGGTMPPKSTWFSPKPMSGLLLHPLDG